MPSKRCFARCGDAGDVDKKADSSSTTLFLFDVKWEVQLAVQTVGLHALRLSLILKYWHLNPGIRYFAMSGLQVLVSANRSNDTHVAAGGKRTSKHFNDSFVVGTAAVAFLSFHHGKSVDGNL